MRLLNTQRWEAQRAQGFRRFVLVTGIFRVALPVVALVVAGDWLIFSRDPYLASLPGLRLKLAGVSALLFLVATPVFGVVWGVLTWKANEWLYHRYTGRAAAGA